MHPFGIKRTFNKCYLLLEECFCKLDKIFKSHNRYINFNVGLRGRDIVFNKKLSRNKRALPLYIITEHLKWVPTLIILVSVLLLQSNRHSWLCYGL